MFEISKLSYLSEASTLEKGKNCLLNTTGWERTGQMLYIVDTSLSVLITLRMCLCELCYLFTVWI